MLEGKKLGFIGGGQMCEAILAGVLAAGALAPQNTYVTDISAQRLQLLERQYGVETRTNDENNTGAKALIDACDILVLAIKPQLVQGVLPAIGGLFGPRQLVVSIIGGTRLQTLEGFIPNAPVIRVMPNTPMLVRLGDAALAPGSGAKEEHLALCRALFETVGAVHVLDESLINPFTAVSGCGPAYAYLFIEALADGGVRQGLPRALAVQSAAQMLAGAAQMVLQTGRHPAELKDSVCSPGGGTIAGVQALQSGGFAAAVMDAVAAGRKRMDELG